MAQQTVNTTAPGDTLKAGGDKINANFTELYGRLALTQAERNKLAGVETGATADQTGAEIVGLIDDQLGGTAWQGGGGSTGSVSINAQTGTTYTLAPAAPGKLVTMANAGANTVTIAANSTVAMPRGATCTIGQLGAGPTTITAAAGVTLNGVLGGSATIGTRFQAVSLIELSIDNWWLSGDHSGVA